MLAVVLLADAPVVYGLLCIVCFGLLFEWGPICRIRNDFAKIAYAFVGTAIAVVIPLFEEQAIYITAVCGACAVVPAIACVASFLCKVPESASPPSGLIRRLNSFWMGLRRVLTSAWITGPLGYVVCASAMVCCGHLEGGGFALIGLLAVVWLADIGAYFAGTYLGAHQLNAELSPSKTWEGVVGGLVLSVSCCLVVDLWLGWIELNAIWAWFCIAFVAVLGDLFESALKRVVEMKDSSELLPGHGGLLDRLDSLLLSAPCAYLILAL